MWGKGGLEGEHLVTVTWQLQVADDRGTEETHHVGQHREGEPRKDLFAHRRPADDVAPLEHQHLVTGLCQVGGADQPVVSGPDNDGVVSLAHHDLFLGGLKKGVSTTVAVTW